MKSTALKHLPNNYDLLIAKDEIFQLMVKYGHGLDLRDGELLRSIFTDPFEMDFSELNGQPAAQLTPALLADTALHLLKDMNTVHQITTPRIEVDGDCAAGLFDIVAWHYKPCRDGESEYVVRGFYDQKFERQRGQWKIVQHKIRVAYCTGNPNLFDFADVPNQ